MTFDELLDEYGLEFMNEEYPDDSPQPMEALDELFSSYEAVRAAFYGGRYGFKQDVFNPNDEYFKFDGNGNIQSIPYVNDYLNDVIDEDDFIQWCKEKGYVDDEDEGAVESSLKRKARKPVHSRLIKRPSRLFRRKG